MIEMVDSMVVTWLVYEVECWKVLEVFYEGVTWKISVRW